MRPVPEPLTAWLRRNGYRYIETHHAARYVHVMGQLCGMHHMALAVATFPHAASVLYCYLG